MKQVCSREMAELNRIYKETENIHSQYAVAPGFSTTPVLCLSGSSSAAINLAMPLVMINFALADMIGVGSAVPISLALGEQDEERAGNIFSCAIHAACHWLQLGRQSL